MDTELDIKDIIPSRPHKAWITAKSWRRSKGQCTVHIQWTAGANQRRLSVNVKSADNKKALKGTDDFLASNTTEVKRHLASTFERMQDEPAKAAHTRAHMPAACYTCALRSKSACALWIYTRALVPRSRTEPEGYFCVCVESSYLT